MDKEADTKAIEKWLRLVDKPLVKKEEDKEGKKNEQKNQTRKKE